MFIRNIMGVLRMKTTCDSCKEVKKAITKKGIGKKFFLLCLDCIENLKWTQASLRSGTNEILERLPERFKRVSQYSVTSIE
jgi:hypothetical protein